MVCLQTSTGTMRGALALWGERSVLGAGLGDRSTVVGSGTLCYFRLKTREPRNAVGWGRHMSLMNYPFPDCGALRHLGRRERSNRNHLVSESRLYHPWKVHGPFLPPGSYFLSPWGQCFPYFHLSRLTQIWDMFSNKVA